MPEMVHICDCTHLLGQPGDRPLSVVLSFTQGAVTEVAIVAGPQEGKLLAYKATGPDWPLARLAALTDYLPAVFVVVDKGAAWLFNAQVEGQVQGMVVGEGQQVTMDFSASGARVESARPTVRVEVIVPGDATVEVYGPVRVTCEPGLAVVVH